MTTNNSPIIHRQPDLGNSQVNSNNKFSVNNTGETGCFNNMDVCDCAIISTFSCLEGTKNSALCFISSLAITEMCCAASRATAIIASSAVGVGVGVATAGVMFAAGVKMHADINNHKPSATVITQQPEIKNNQQNKLKQP